MSKTNTALVCITLFFGGVCNAYADQKKGYISAKTGVAVGSQNAGSDAYGSFGFNGQLNQNISMGVKGVYFGNHQQDDSTFGVELTTRLSKSVGKQARLYLEGGVGSVGDHLSFGAGFTYQLVEQLALDFGYHYYGGVTEHQGDIYAMGIGLQYQYPSDAADRRSVTLRPYEPDEPKPDINDPVTDHVIQKPVLVDNEINPERIGAGVIVCVSPVTARTDSADVAKSVACSNQNQVMECYRGYRVVEGDWQIKIARQQGITLSELRRLNPALNFRETIFPGQVLLIQKLDK